MHKTYRKKHTKYSGYFSRVFVPMVKLLIKSCLWEISDFTRVISVDRFIQQAQVSLKKIIET